MSLNLPRVAGSIGDRPEIIHSIANDNVAGSTTESVTIRPPKGEVWVIKGMALGIAGTGTTTQNIKLKLTDGTITVEEMSRAAGSGKHCLVRTGNKSIGSATVDFTGGLAEASADVFDSSNWSAYLTNTHYMVIDFINDDAGVVGQFYWIELLKTTEAN